MKSNFLLKNLLDLSLECRDVDLPRLNGPIDSYAQGESVLVLMGKRN
jgi:hypothetical protein